MQKPFDLLSEFSKFSAERKISLREPASALAFTKHVRHEIGRAINDPVLLHGQRVEAMFEALLVSLGQFKLLKREDVGLVHPTDRFRTPDFRVVLIDGRQWVIEVKNVHMDGSAGQTRRIMTRDYRERMNDYASATGAVLKLAVFWSRWALWTLVSPDQMVDANGDLTLDLVTAMKANEFAQLGDRTIGTRPPLRLRLTADPARTDPIADDGTVRVTFGRTQIFCGGEEIADPIEREIAWIFMRHGDWEETGPEAIVDGARLDAIEFRWDPTERTDQGFEFVGSLTRMFARFYAEQTVQDREVTGLRAPLRPGWFDPLVSSNHLSKALPLWIFTLQPNFNGRCAGLNPHT